MKPRGHYKPRKAPSKPTTIGQRIRSLRLHHGFTQAQVAKSLFTDQTTISAWERGKAEPSGAALAALCALFEVSRDYLESGKGLGKVTANSSSAANVAGGIQLYLDPLKIKGHAGGLVDMLSGQVQFATIQEMRDAMEDAVSTKKLVWVVRQK